MREARSIRTQNPAVSLYRFAITAFPSHREHVALQRQPFASALALPRGNNPFPSLQVHSIASALPSHRPVSIGFGLAMRVRSSVGFLILLPTFLVHRAVQMACRHTPFRGFQNVREAPPITTQNPSVGLYRFATAFPGHRKHVALQRQSFASAWPVAILQFRGFQNVREARPIRTQNSSVGLYRFATAFPGHREHVALQRQPFASAWPCRHTPFRGFQNVREARPIRTQNPSVGLYCFATAQHVAPQRQSFASAWPGRHTPFRGFQNVRGPSRHKTPLWAFTALPLPSQVTANTLPCSGSPLPAPGHVAILHLEGFKTCAKHGPSRHKTPLWAFTALPLPSQVTANTLPCSGSPLPAPGHVALLHLEGVKTCVKHGPSGHKNTQNPAVSLYR